MPEGDSVWRSAAQLHAALAGQKLTGSDFRVPRFATLKLDGWTIDEVVPRGKHLLMRLRSPAEEQLTIHSHLKMEGAWQVYPPGGRWRKPGFTARCVLRTATADAVGFSLGILEVVRTADEDSIVGHLGPDLLGPDWDAAEAERRLRAAPEVPIGVALLDQRNLAGIGNIYRCEACFLSGIHPATPVSDVPDLPAMMAHAKQLLEANLGPGRRSTVLNEGRIPVGRMAGRLGYWVYRRERQPCLKCGTPIRRGALAKGTRTDTATATATGCGRLTQAAGSGAGSGALAPPDSGGRDRSLGLLSCRGPDAGVARPGLPDLRHREPR